MTKRTPPGTNSIIQWLKDWLPALPLLVIAYGLLVMPIAGLLIQSVMSEGQFTLAHWLEALTSPINQRAILTSITLGIVSATISLIIGSPIAWFISRMASGQRSLWLAALNTATNFGGISLAFGFVAILGTYGMLTLFLQQLTIPFIPPASGSFWGLIMAYAFTDIPLFVLVTVPGMGMLRQEWWEAAQTSGATQWQFWRSVGLPLLAPFLGAGWVLIFTWSIGLYALPLALGGGAARNVFLITLQIGNTLEANVSGPGESAVLSMLLLLLAGFSLITYRLMLQRAARWF
ncbi:MAG: ABC transporter permease subunit [Elainellaceae cyanobacterium]